MIGTMEPAPDRRSATSDAPTDVSTLRPIKWAGYGAYQPTGLGRLLPVVADHDRQRGVE